MDFKGNDMGRIAQYATTKCRFTADGKVAYSDAVLIAYPMSGSQEPNELNTFHCKSPKWDLNG
jgi:hypothetical protein